MGVIIMDTPKTERECTCMVQDRDREAGDAGPRGQRQGPPRLLSVFLCQRDRLRRIAAGLGMNSADAEDVLQDVSIHVLKYADRFEQESLMMRWLVKTTVNHCLSEHRRRFRRKASRILRRRPDLGQVLGTDCDATDRAGLGEELEIVRRTLAELDQLTETTQQSLDTLAKTVAYRTEGEAQAAIGELDRMLNASQVEIAGVMAKIEAIQAYRQERREEGRPVPQEATAKLNMMFVEESIALRGAEARKQMAIQLREQAGRFVDLKSTLARAAREKPSLVKNLEKHREEVPGRRQWLETAKQREPQIPDKIVIYPVQWGEQAPGSN